MQARESVCKLQNCDVLCGNVITNGVYMARSVTFRIEDETLVQIDRVAALADRDRSYLINEALADYLEIQRWQVEGIDRAIADADAGRFATPEQVSEAFAAFKAPLAV
jgi:predicted transcriptional regulator